MGMDIDGRKPDSSLGEDIRFNIWAWPPILEIISAADPALDIKGWQYNDGHGLKTAKQSRALATKIRKYLESKDTIQKFETKQHNGMTASMSQMFGIKQEGLLSVQRESVLRFCDFLDHCGGFRIH